MSENPIDTIDNCYSRIRQMLSAVFSIETGLSESAAKLMLERALENKDWRDQFKQELVQAFSDSETRWSNLLFNDDYEVLEAETEAEARTFAGTILWNTTFPGRPIPEGK